jgi:hypothetical protein
MPIILTIEIPDTVIEFVVRAIMDNYPEASATLHCRRWDYERCQYQFLDCETGKTYDLNLQALTSALVLLFSDKWPKGCTAPPRSSAPEHWEDWLGNSDVIDYDAFVQLAALGEVIYG